MDGTYLMLWDPDWSSGAQQISSNTFLAKKKKKEKRKRDVSNQRADFLTPQVWSEHTRHKRPKNKQGYGHFSGFT